MFPTLPVIEPRFGKFKFFLPQRVNGPVRSGVVAAVDRDAVQLAHVRVAVGIVPVLHEQTAE
jgi:hypothetical protein